MQHNLSDSGSSSMKTALILGITSSFLIEVYQSFRGYYCFGVEHRGSTFPQTTPLFHNPKDNTMLHSFETSTV